MGNDHKPTPEEILARLKSQERKQGRGRLKLFLGFAAGVGKTYSMLSEANRRRLESGQDVVIGYVETHGRRETEAQIGDLERLPLKSVPYKGTALTEMDAEAILARRPQWAVVDELAHTNAPGSRNEKRYQDVLDLLDAGINVLSALNVQHLESLNDAVLQITGIKIRETVPDWVLAEADEIVSVDLTPRALIHRLERGDIYPQEKVPIALANFFTEGNLSALREIALREVASAVDRSVQIFREDQGVREPWGTRERIMVCLSPNRTSDRLLRRGSRIARRLRAEIVAVHVTQSRPTEMQQRLLDADFARAERMHIAVERISGRDVAQTLAEYARRHQITQIVIGHARQSRWQEFLRGSVINSLIRLVRGIDVHVVADEN